MKKTLFLAVAAAFLSAPAMAQDTAFDGLYLGLQGGYGQVSPDGGDKDSGFSGGAYGGYGVTFGKLYVAGEASVDLVRGEISGGGNLPRISPMSGTVSVTADNGPLSLRTEARFVAEQTRVFQNELPTDGYTLLNADARWRPFADRDVQLLLGVRNITDEEGRIHSSFLKDFIPLPGRSVRLALSSRF